MQREPMRARPGFRQVKGGGMSMSQREDMLRARQHIALQNINNSQGGTIADGDIIDTSRHHVGSGFRKMFWIIVFGLIILIMGVKFYGEVGLKPESELWQEAEEREDMTQQYFETIQKGDQREAKAKEGEIKNEGAQERYRRERIARRELERAHNQFMEKMNSGSCDDECLANMKAVQVKFDQVTTKPIEPYGSVLGVKNTMDKREIREKYNELKQRFEDEETEILDSGLDLAEVQEAYGVLMNNEARAYYNLYDSRPPAHMRSNARIAIHGGPGQEFQLQSWKAKMMLAWLEYFNNKYADFGALFMLALVSALPIIGNIRPFIRMIRSAFPEIDPETSLEHNEKMAELRRIHHRGVHRR
eukprot:TRINITY_DN383_c0_g3_i1.p1 TRINITY_DN383_c0_g3~~TRINITY_DN383_c0_g3_i1.p1  ORF type:complete len:360 (+),score=72.31 TRINITY_DN383_c0_g3_i1:52-1131(+)